MHGNDAVRRVRTNSASIPRNKLVNVNLNSINSSGQSWGPNPTIPLTVFCYGNRSCTGPQSSDCRPAVPAFGPESEKKIKSKQNYLSKVLAVVEETRSEQTANLGREHSPTPFIGRNHARPRACRLSVSDAVTSRTPAATLTHSDVLGEIRRVERGAPSSSTQERSGTRINHR